MGKNYHVGGLVARPLPRHSTCPRRSRVRPLRTQNQLLSCEGGAMWKPMSGPHGTILLVHQSCHMLPYDRSSTDNSSYETCPIWSCHVNLCHSSTTTCQYDLLPRVSMIIFHINGTTMPFQHLCLVNNPHHHATCQYKHATLTLYGLYS
jgi:hypothetical protein